MLRSGARTTRTRLPHRRLVLKSETQPLVGTTRAATAIAILKKPESIARIVLKNGLKTIAKRLDKKLKHIGRNTQKGLRPRCEDGQRTTRNTFANPGELMLKNTFRKS